MQRNPSRQSFVLAVALSLSSILLSPPTARATATPVDETHLTMLRGTVHPLAQPAFDRGAVPDDFPVQRMFVMLKPSPEHDAALQRFLRELHTPGSSSFHQWVTPEIFGQRFGANDDDIQVIIAWLQAHGFSVARVTGSKMLLEFSGTAGQVRQTLHTEIHSFTAGDRNFYGNDREISVPDAISSRIRNFAPLNTYPLTNYAVKAGTASALRRDAGGPSPRYTFTVNSAPFYALAPEDFATQYDVGPVYKAAINGSGQTIGIIGESNVNLALVEAYRQFFNLPTNQTQVIIDGEDPGDALTPNTEGLLDLEISGSVAPNATINFYVAGGGQLFQSSVFLAALRAVEDNQVSVLSVSYGQCEQLLGETQNQLWAALWQQAAAQGQTVLVASGDTGPAACSLLGLTVNGLSSTPWNVSVGATDFYYSDYASGGSSITSLWNSTNDASLGSLKAPLPEQPWDDALGFDIVPYGTVLDGGAFVSGGVIPSPAGGGGVSNCSQETPTSPGVFPSCIAGYAKPAWQQGTGVPADGARDLPDVSLFAADGQNLSAWPICAEPGDCAAGAASTVTLVGGTSTSTPAMAGIMALVDQKYGRQGQADYILYALARQQSSVFHDVTIGTNDILCMSGAPLSGMPSVPGCTVPQTYEGFTSYSFGVYPAGAGYDLASGLGSLDVNNLISNWNQISLLPTTSTLQLSPTTFTHGSPVAVTSSVQSGSGAGTPSGDVVLQTDPVSALRGAAVLALTNGTASGNVTTLPGGTYQLVAQYAGDGVFAASTSAPVTVTVAPESSTTSLSVFPAPVNGQVAFGALTLEATPTGTTTNSSGLATGSATFTDGSISATVPLNANGMATWSPQSPAIGPHSVTVNYSGDASYSPSTGGPLTFTVIKGTPTLVIDPLEEGPIENCPTGGGLCTSSFLAGSSLLVQVLFRASNANVPPTGTVTFTLGALSQTVPVVQASYINESLSSAEATFSNVPAGTYTLSANYSGDSNWNAASNTYAQQVSFVASTSVATSTTTLTASTATVDSSDSVTFTITVTASTDQYGTPFGLVALVANGTPIADAVLGGSGIIPVSTTETTKITVPASIIPVGQLSVIAVYQGSPGVASSVSASVALSVTASDFRLSASVPSLTLPSGQSGTVSLLLGGPYGISVPVALACTLSSSSFACSVNPASPTVNGSATAALTITAAVSNTSATLATRPRSNAEGWFRAYTPMLAFATLLLFPFRVRRKLIRKSLLLLVLLVIAAGCGGNGHPTTPPPTSATTPTPPGAYQVLITATGKGIVHNLQLTVIVSPK